MSLPDATPFALFQDTPTKIDKDTIHHHHTKSAKTLRRFLESVDLLVESMSLPELVPRTNTKSSKVANTVDVVMLSSKSSKVAHLKPSPRSIDPIKEISNDDKEVAKALSYIQYPRVQVPDSVAELSEEESNGNMYGDGLCCSLLCPYRCKFSGRELDKISDASQLY